MNSHGAELLDRVRSILNRKWLTIAQLSRLSEDMFGRSSKHYLPLSFYRQLRTGTECPNIYQLFAMSCFSGYQIVDWLRVFGFNLDEILHLQTLPRRPQTVLLDSESYDKGAWVSWFKGNSAASEFGQVVPMARMLKKAGMHQVHSLERLNTKSFLYAKIGQKDALVSPDLAADSIVRVEPLPAGVSAGTGVSSEVLYLVEQGERLMCRRIADPIFRCPSGNVASKLTELGRHENESQIKILGTLDLELRPTRNATHWCVPLGARRWQSKPTRSPKKGPSLGGLIRTFRLRSGLDFREASFISQLIANALDDERYYIAPNAISSYEERDITPRQIQKILSLCILYCIGFWDFLEGAGIDLRQLGREPVSEDILPRCSPSIRPRLWSGGEGALQLAPVPAPLSWLEEIPLFLRHTLSELMGIRSLSIRDIFSTKAVGVTYHPLLRGSRFIVVDRRLKRPAPVPRSRSLQDSLFLVLLRDGTYVCSHCRVKDRILTLVPRDSPLPLRELQNGKDAEIIGGVTAIVRKLGAP